MVRHIFNTQLPVGACNRRLEAAAERDVPIIASMRFSYGILARIDDNGFRLRVRRPFIHNGISPRLRVRYRPTASATLLELRYRINPLWTIWYVCVAAFAGWMVVVNAAELLRRGFVVPGACCSCLSRLRHPLYLFGAQRPAHFDTLHRTDAPCNSSRRRKRPNEPLQRTGSAGR